MGSSAGLDPALLIEPELFAQEEILGGELSFGSQAEGQQAKQIGKGVQPTQAACHHAPTSFDFDLHPSIWPLFCPFQVRSLVFA